MTNVQTTCANSLPASFVLGIPFELAYPAIAWLCCCFGRAATLHSHGTFPCATFGTLFGIAVLMTRNPGHVSMGLSEAGRVALLAGPAFGLVTASWYCHRLGRQQHCGAAVFGYP